MLFCAGISGSGVGALRKHAGGMFLASDLGGYAAVASILSLKVPSYVGGRTGSSAPTDAVNDGAPVNGGRGTPRVLVSLRSTAFTPPLRQGICC